MCLKFAKQCVKLDKMKKLFPRNVNAHKMNKRSTDIEQVYRTRQHFVCSAKTATAV